MHDIPKINETLWEKIQNIPLLQNKLALLKIYSKEARRIIPSFPSFSFSSCVDYSQKFSNKTLLQTCNALFQTNSFEMNHTNCFSKKLMLSINFDENISIPDVHVIYLPKDIPIIYRPIYIYCDLLSSIPEFDLNIFEKK